MRKLIMIATAIAVLAVPSLASADVARYQDNQQADFTMTQAVRNSDGSGAGTLGDWVHKVTVKVNPCDNTFVGTAKVSAVGGPMDGLALARENLSGSFGANGTVSFTLTRPDYVGVETLVDAPMDGTTVSHPTTTGAEQYELDMKVTAPTFSNIVGGVTYKNHGDYVKGQGGGADAAHSCIGMPIVSSQGSK